MSIDKKEILEKADIVSVISSRITLKKMGHNYEGKCPFHNERSASFKVSPSKKIYKCFGCGRSGDVLSFIEQFDRVDFPEAIRRIAEMSGIQDTESVDETKIYSFPELCPTPLHQELLDYLVHERKLSAATIDQLNITESELFFNKRKKKIPVICFNFYHRGVLKNIKYRSLAKDMQMASGCELIPYNVDAIKNESEVCITEGEIDCASLVEAGINNAVSVPNGAGGSITWIGKHFDKKERIILFTDDDEAGNKLKQKLIHRLGYHRCYEVTYPEGCKDANKVLQDHGPDVLRQMKENAQLVPLPDAPVAVDLTTQPIDPDSSMTFATVLATGKLSYKPNLPGILKWARDIGYCWVKYSDEDNAPTMLVQHMDNIIYPVSDQDVLAEYQKEIDLNYSHDNSERVILYNFAKSFQQVLVLLPYFNGKLLTDKKELAYLCFLNGVLCITKDTANFVTYASLDAFVFSRYIIQHHYTPAASDGNFLDFVSALSVNEDHAISILSHLGYLLHSYKLRTTAKAVIIVEDVDDESEARGRSGKGLLAQFVELFKNTIQIDGRNYKADDKFKLQRVDISTQVFYINDPAPNLLMNQFYNMITDDFLVEAKGQKSYTIPFERSAKLLITTNHLPALSSDSDSARFAILAIKKTFGAKNQVSDRFPGVFFFHPEHWPENEFQAAFQLAVDAIQVWLTLGLVSYSSPEMALNQSKRLLGSQVPEYILETVGQIMAIRHENVSENLFKEAIRNIDLSIYRDLLDQAFKWTEQGIDIWTTPFYRYCKLTLKANVSQVWFGRKLRYFLEESKIAFDERRSDITGRKVTVYINSFQSNLPL